MIKSHLSCNVKKNQNNQFFQLHWPFFLSQGTGFWKMSQLDQEEIKKKKKKVWYLVISSNFGKWVGLRIFQYLPHNSRFQRTKYYLNLRVFHLPLFPFWRMSGLAEIVITLSTTRLKILNGYHLKSRHKANPHLV